MIRAKCRCCDDVVFVQQVTIVGADELDVLDAVDAIACSPSLYVYYDECDPTDEAVSADGKAKATVN